MRLFSGEKTMSTNNAISGQGATLGVTTTTPPTSYTLIGQISEYPLSTGQASKLDASNLNSIEKEYIAGLKDHGTATIKGQYVRTDAGHTVLRSNVGNGVVCHFQATLPNGQVATFDAQVGEF